MSLLVVNYDLDSTLFETLIQFLSRDTNRSFSKGKQIDSETIWLKHAFRRRRIWSTTHLIDNVFDRQRIWSTTHLVNDAFMQRRVHSKKPSFKDSSTQKLIYPRRYSIFPKRVQFRIGMALTICCWVFGFLIRSDTLTAVTPSTTSAKSSPSRKSTVKSLTRLFDLTLSR